MTEIQKSRSVKTPWHLWVVGIIAALWSAMGAVDYVMTETKNEAYMSKFTAEQLAFFYNLPVWVVAAWATAVWGGVLGAVLLLLRKKFAVWVLLVSLIAMVLTTIHNFVFSNGMEIMGDGASLGFSAAIFLISVALFLYAQAMEKRGILQ